MTALDLDRNSIGAEGVKALSNAIARPFTTKRLQSEARNADKELAPCRARREVLALESGGVHLTDRPVCRFVNNEGGHAVSSRVLRSFCCRIGR